MQYKVPFTIQLQINKQDKNNKQFNPNQKLVNYRFEDNSANEFIKGFLLQDAFGVNTETELKKYLLKENDAEEIILNEYMPSALNTSEQKKEESTSNITDILSTRLDDISMISLNATYYAEDNENNILVELDVYEHENGITREFLTEYTSKHSFSIGTTKQLTLLAYLLNRYYLMFAEWVQETTEYKYYDVVPYSAYTKFGLLEAVLTLLARNVPAKLRWLNLGNSNLRKLRVELSTALTYPEKISSSKVICMTLNNGDMIKKVLKYIGLDGKPSIIPRITIRSPRKSNEVSVWTKANLCLD